MKYYCQSQINTFRSILFSISKVKFECLSSVDCLYTPTAHLHHNFEAKVIPPGHAEDVTFTFYPREAIKYKEVITFEINGLSKQSMEIHGQGTEMRVS